MDENRGGAMTGDGERVAEEKEGIGIHHTCRGPLQLYITVRSAYAARAA